MDNIQSACIQNSGLWKIIIKLQKTRKEKIILTSQQRFALCNYINGQPYDKKVLKSFIY